MFSFLTLFFTVFSYKEAVFFLVVQSCELQQNDELFYFIFTDVTEVFSLYLQLAVFFSSQISFWVLVYHIFIFFSSALYKTEYKLLNQLFKISIIIWFFSSVLAYHFFIPISWKFFLSFQQMSYVKSLNFFLESKLLEFFNFFTQLYFICVLSTQVFVYFIVLIFKSSSDFLKLRKFRKLYYYLFLIFSTFVSPPDVISQLFISITGILVFELSVFMMVYLKKFLIR